MKYIFVVGAPGSKWSSVVKNIYWSDSIDSSDYSDARTYFHDATGTLDLMHLGAYYDPGMEFGDFFDNLSSYTKQQCELEFDRPFFLNKKARIIKSHVFAHHVDFLKSTWPESPVVLVHRTDDSCLGWWVKCGHFDITYPLYHSYYKDLRHMARIIAHQNRDILQAWHNYHGCIVEDNVQLAEALKITQPPQQFKQDYVTSDLKVKVI